MQFSKSYTKSAAVNIEVLMSQSYRYMLGNQTYHFKNLAQLMAKATPQRSGDRLAGVIAHSAEERAVAQMTLADVPLKNFLNEALIPYEKDEITRLILDEHDITAFAYISHLTVGDNPATDNVAQAIKLMKLMDDVIQKYQIPTQSCVLTHVTNTIECIEAGAPVDLVFQSIGGTEATNSSFGFNLNTLAEAQDAALSLQRGTIGSNVMYFETGQGSALSANAHHGLDQQTCESRAYAVARKFNPLLVNTVVGFIGPEYLFDGKEITRAGLEDHFCGKLLGIPMGCDVCYTNHAEADQNDMDNLLTLLGVAGCSFVMGIPGSDDIMLNYQTTSFHDALYVRRVLGSRPAPEFEQWLTKMNIMQDVSDTILSNRLPSAFAKPLRAIQGGH
jgi:ethanolamine ammonia-lyase large subunit